MRRIAASENEYWERIDWRDWAHDLALIQQDENYDCSHTPEEFEARIFETGAGVFSLACRDKRTPTREVFAAGILPCPGLMIVRSSGVHDNRHFSTGDPDAFDGPENPRAARACRERGS